MAPADGLRLEDETSLRAAYAAHGGELYRFALRSLGDAGAAEEAVQETFVRAWRAGERFDPSLGSLRTWLFAIARNVVIDIGRARASRPPLAGEEGLEPTSEDPVEVVMIAWQVEEALRRISDDHRTAIIETYYRARPHAEVAAELRIPEGTLRSRIFYGLKALRLALEEMGWTDEQ
ncbi:MAG TPA: sigma-70 family RNA polymerase sigma factor [Actinomycetota bacterium]|jgi:RNA polymerase sigma-70 factor (ECF subfamily)|nr:sigma-70 family RNA polymerase sigma factor [Actinomycetota bacterium]